MRSLRSYGRRAAAALLAAALLCIGPRHTALAQSDADIVVPTYRTVKNALALIAARNPYGMAVGSGFCISSNATTSYVLTNYHVIAQSNQILVAFQSPTLKHAYAKVYRSNPDDDIAILAVPIGGIPPLPLAKGRATEGTRIATAGYPSTNIELAMAGLGITPSVHVGLINALLSKGRVILFDAQTEHGNSGGPLFDLHTAVVYGVVFAKMGGYRESNLALSIDFLTPFLNGSHLALAPVPAGTPRPTPEPPPLPPPEPLTVTEADMIHALSPVYPDAARAGGWSGEVDVKVDLDANATVVAVTVQRSSGHPELDEAALFAAKNSGYRAKRVGDRAVAGSYLARYQFGTP